MIEDDIKSFLMDYNPDEHTLDEWVDELMTEINPYIIDLQEQVLAQESEIISLEEDMDNLQRENDDLEDQVRENECEECSDMEDQLDEANCTIEQMDLENRQLLDTNLIRRRTT